MEICGYLGAMKRISRAKSESNYKGDNGYVGTSVNENGVLDVLKSTLMF